jgi:hypothetical protein
VKRRARTTSVPSMIKPTYSFTAREREAYAAWQAVPADATPGWVTGYEAALIGRLIHDEADIHLSAHAMMHATGAVEPRVERLTQGQASSPVKLALLMAAAHFFQDNATDQEVEEVLDAVEACWNDPMPAESWVLGSIDVAKLVRHIREVTTRVLAQRGKPQPTLDETYRMMFDRAGRGAADHMLTVLRSKGALGTLRATKGITHVVDRAQYERLIRGLGRKIFCSDVYCAGESPYEWADVVEFAEDGKIAVHVRRQERRDGTWVTAVAGWGRPSGINELLEEANAENGYVVIETEPQV